MTTNAMAIRGIGQIALTVSDVERARTFYRDVLELDHLFDAAPKMSFFQCGGVRLLLGEGEEGAEETHASILYLDVADIRAAYDTLVERGVEFEAGPHKVADLGDRELWLAFFRDSEQSMMALMSEIAKTG